MIEYNVKHNTQDVEKLVPCTFTKKSRHNIYNKSKQLKQTL